MSTPRAVAFYSPDAPERERWIAHLYQPTRPTKKQIEEGRISPDGRLQMTFSSASKAGALAKAEAWWKEEVAKVAKAKQLVAVRAENARKTRAVA